VSKTASESTIKVVVDVHPGPVSPAQKAAWRKFWTKLLSEPKREQ